MTGLSSEVWSEGLGWYALILAETLAVLPASHPRRAEVLDIFVRLAGGLVRTQDPATGGWFQVVDKGDRRDNWIDTSGTAMFTYALQRGIEIGTLKEAEYKPVVARGYQCIVDNATADDNGLVDVHSACDGLCVQQRLRRLCQGAESHQCKRSRGWVPVGHGYCRETGAEQLTSCASGCAHPGGEHSSR